MTGDTDESCAKPYQVPELTLQLTLPLDGLDANKSLDVAGFRTEVKRR